MNTYTYTHIHTYIQTYILEDINTYDANFGRPRLLLSQHSSYTVINTYTHIYLHTFMHTCILQTQTHIHTCTHSCIHVDILTYRYTYIHMMLTVADIVLSISSFKLDSNTHIHTHTYTHIHTHTDTHIHTYDANFGCSWGSDPITPARLHIQADIQTHMYKCIYTCIYIHPITKSGMHSPVPKR